MATTAVKPTRMEMNRLRARLKTATRGHKLLKDKRDELMRRFMALVRENRALRERVEARLAVSQSALSVAAAVMSPEILEQSLLYPKRRVAVGLDFSNMMGVTVPQYSFRTEGEGDSLPYGYATTSGELDDAIRSTTDAFTDMLELARIEKTVQLLAIEIEKTRRRVNALEYVMIPELRTGIKYIRMKLDENERGNITRLMKVKDAILAEAHGYGEPSEVY
ncbi:MAG: V-type ATP synthase subunit D [Oscillospiraceae bacterium]|jgi:V/A-type H+-transporting ATPase subunit D|nr:V-type ATP synthase subunit D [Oscillospiraceae bacterium]